MKHLLIVVAAALGAVGVVSVDAAPVKHHPAARLDPNARSPLFQLYAAELAAVGQGDEFSDGLSFERYEGKAFDIYVPVVSDTVSGPHYSYDKEAQKLTIEFNDGIYTSSFPVKRGVSPHRVYIGTNAFGARVRVEKYSTLHYDLDREIKPFEATMAGEDARQFVRGLKVHVVGIIRGAEGCSTEHREPKIDNPYDVTETDCGVYADYTHVSLVKEGKEVWSADLTDQQP